MQLPRWLLRCHALRRRIIVSVWVGLLLLNIAMYVTARRWEYQIVAGQFAKECAQIEHSVEEAFHHSRSQLRMLAAAWEIQRVPTAWEFRAFTQPMIQESPYILEIGWVIPVDERSLSRWERDVSRQMGRDVQVRDLMGRRVVPHASPHYPLRFVEPMSNRGVAIGFDLSTDPERLYAMQEAARTGESVATAPALRFPGLQDTTGLVLAVPLFRNGVPDSFLLAALDPQSVVKVAFRKGSAEGLTLSIRDSSSGREAARHQTSSRPPSDLVRQHNWKFAGRDWRLEIRAHRDFIESRLTRLPEIGFLIGCILVVAIGAQVLAARRDIHSARKRARRRTRKLRKLNSELKAEVVERREAEVRLATYSEQLEQATLLAESSAQAKSNFLATVSHEIRTPMHAIIGMTNILLDSPLNPDQRESAGIVLRSADSLLQIINDILDFSKIEAGKFETEAVPFDLQQTLSEVMDAVSVRAGQKGISLLVGYPNDAPVRFLGDGGAIRQILLNLAGNAVKFTERGQVAVDVLVLEEDENMARMYISVTDTGVGIPEDRLHRLFHPFQQADSSMRRKFGGTGLGLAISRRLTELMGGTITVDSEVNVGTIFQLDLPLRKDHSTSSWNCCPLDLRNVHVLVAEPNPAIAVILAKQLDGCHVTYRQASTMAELHDLLHAEDPGYRICLVGGEVSDSWSPQHIASEIRRHTTQKPALVRIAPYAVSGERAEMEEAGFSAYLVMPVFAAVLMNALGQAWAAAKHGLVPKPILTRQSLSDDAAQGSLAEPLSALCRVLLVEDNAVNQKIGKRLLEKLNCTVDIAPNGLAAVRQWSAETYDVILMDCQMPEMDGFEATAEIRMREAQAVNRRRTPIIAMTANNMQGDREQCLESGMDDFLPKPVSFAELREKLENAIRQTATAAPPLQAEPATADEKSGVTIF